MKYWYILMEVTVLVHYMYVACSDKIGSLISFHHYFVLGDLI